MRVFGKKDTGPASRPEPAIESTTTAHPEPDEPVAAVERADDAYADDGRRVPEEAAQSENTVTEPVAAEAGSYVETPARRKTLPGTDTADLQFDQGPAVREASADDDGPSGLPWDRPWVEDAQLKGGSVYDPDADAEPLPEGMDPTTENVVFGGSPLDDFGDDDASGHDGPHDGMSDAPEAPASFETVIDTEPVPPDLTFSSLSAIMSHAGDAVYVSVAEDPGIGSKYSLADALLKFGNCRVRQVESVIADNEVQLIYRVMMRDEPVDRRLRVNESPLPYDVPCWRIGNWAILHMDLPNNGNGEAPRHEEVKCRIVDAVRGNNAVVTVLTEDGMEISGVPVDRLFLPGVDDAACESMSEEERSEHLCELLRDSMEY